MEEWEHVTTMREIVREDSPVRQHDTRVEGTREEKKGQKQVDSD